jgi:hypothetical protein
LKHSIRYSLDWFFPGLQYGSNYVEGYLTITRCKNISVVRIGNSRTVLLAIFVLSPLLNKY